MSYSIGLVSLGCPKNQVDAEIMLANLIDNGCEIVDFYDGADAVIINTCGFIDAAKQEAIENILEVTDLKDRGIVKKVIVTGCLSQLHKEEIKNEIPEVDAVLGIGANASIFENIKSTIEDGVDVISFPPRRDLPLNGARLLTTPEYWAYLRIAEGCSNNCSYCLIPSIRGPFRSRPMEELVDEAKDLAQKGVKELILIAQDTTSYGYDIYGKLLLPSLLDALSEIVGIHWIRLMYCYPDFVTDELIEKIKTNKKILHYIDLPIQHSDDKILSSMNRNLSEEELRALINKMRTEIPDIVIRTTLITGYPGEDEKAFENLATFVNEIEFDRLGCFTFSPQEGTVAYSLDDQVEKELADHRAEIIMRDQYEIMLEINQAIIGKTLEVLVEGYDGYTDTYFGRSYMDAPEIDNKVYFSSEEAFDEGDLVSVEIIGVSEYDLLGKFRE